MANPGNVPGPEEIQKECNAHGSETGTLACAGTETRTPVGIRNIEATCKEEPDAKIASETKKSVQQAEGSRLRPRSSRRRCVRNLEDMDRPWIKAAVSVNLDTSITYFCSAAGSENVQSTQ